MSNASTPDKSGPITAPAVSDSGWKRYTARMSRIVCVSVAMIGGAWLIVLLATRQPVQVHWSVQIMLATLAILSSLLVEHQRQRQWDKPFVQFHKLLTQVRHGEAPIDELSRVGGNFHPLIPLFQEIFRELKQQRGQLTSLNAEMRQRVANRTDALERLVGSLRHQAERDGLTGLYNRRVLDQHLPQVLEKCRLQRQDLALLMTDIDHFKHLNDTLGHAAGDELLKAIGQIARSTIRDGDIAFRCGGDEFVVLLVDCNLKTSQEIAERLMSLTDAFAQTLHLTPRPRLSIGMSLLSELPQATPRMLLQAADKALYDMKAVRKERVEPGQPGCRALSA
jgi:diguanylate cyclase (GGDEF)-like protein